MAKPPPATTDDDNAARPEKASDQRVLPKRFYDQVAIKKTDAGYIVLLDARQVRTPQRAELILPTEGLADAIAEEWRQQSGVIDPETMPITKLCNSALDGVIPNRAVVVDDIVNFAKHDAVCYRASDPVALVQRQNALLDPVITWAEADLGVSWVCTAGVMPVAQPGDVDSAVRTALSNVGPFQLTTLHELTTLTGSALLALAYARDQLSCTALWQAAHIDEDFQIERWGQDSESEARRQRRWQDAQAADRLYRLAGKTDAS